MYSFTNDQDADPKRVIPDSQRTFFVYRALPFKTPEFRAKIPILFISSQ